MAEHAVIVHLRNANLNDILPLEDRLEREIENARTGEYDGNDVALDGSEAILYAYGPDADALWDVIEPSVQEFAPASGSYVVKRYGEASDPAATEVRVDLGGTA
jgi:hypothetical protein